MQDSNANVKKILLVEDDRQLSDLVTDFLTSEGFHVKQEFRGDTVAKRVKLFSPDLIILDVMLPGKDGFGVCRDLRPEFTGPVLMLTAKSTDFDQVLGLEIGADDLAMPAELHEQSSEVDLEAEALDGGVEIRTVDEECNTIGHLKSP